MTTEIQAEAIRIKRDDLREAAANRAKSYFPGNDISAIHLRFKAAHAEMKEMD